MSRLGTVFAVFLVLTSATDALARRESRGESRSDAYREGQRALDDHDWENASRIFGRLAAASTTEADAALYWKAYADWKRSLKTESLDGLRRLQAEYPKSAWIDDAKALELEIRDGKQAAAAIDSGDEELKLYAVDALMQVEPDQAVPVLEKILSKDSSERLKERALFVLSQSDSPRAREILLRTAKSGQPMDLRREAIKVLGIAGLRSELGVLARDTTAPREVRQAVVEAFQISNDTDGLLNIATSDPDPEIRAHAIQALGANGALPSLRRLWSTEKDPALRAKVLEAFGIAGDVDTLAKAAREASEPELRRKAIQGLGISGGPGTATALRQLYGEFSSADDKRAVAQSLMIHGEGKILIELFRAEKDPALKRDLLQQLSLTNDPESTRVILEILGEKR